MREDRRETAVERSAAREDAATRLRRRLAAGPPLLLDGATGTELERRGLPCALPLWSARALIEAPDAVLRIHEEYLDAGAEILTAATFRTQRRTLALAGVGTRAGELTASAVALAREAAGSRAAWVAGSIAPLEDCWRPDLVPDEASLAREHAEHAAHLLRAGADLLLVETMGTRREAMAALRAARATQLPTIVAFACNGAGQLLSGEDVASAAAEAAALGADAVAVNCTPPPAALRVLPSLRAAGIPFGAWPNLGAPIDAAGLLRTDLRTPDAFAADLLHWIEAGARLVGGCCGTSPAHVRALAARMRG